MSATGAPDTATLGAGGAEPALNIVKDAAGGEIADVAGEMLNYTITVSNTGNTTMTGVVVTDPCATQPAPVLVAGFNSGDTDRTTC